MDAVEIFSIFVGLLVLPGYVYILCRMAIKGFLDGVTSTAITYLDTIKEIANAEGRSAESEK